jgi:acetyltransferase-like isoleucine patch superfamily enzyme
MNQLQKLCSLFIGLFPASALKNQLLRWNGHSIDQSARIGPILLVMSVLSIGPNAELGSFSVYLRSRIVLGTQAFIGSFNWVAGSPELIRIAPQTGHTVPGQLILEPQAAITSRHYIDTSGGVYFGGFSTLAGARSTIFTHSINYDRGVLQTSPVSIGKYSIINSNVSITPGSSVPPYSIVAMGSVVTKTMNEPLRLYAGAPAQPKKKLTPHARAFQRLVGAIPPANIPQNEDPEKPSANSTGQSPTDDQPPLK